MATENPTELEFASVYKDENDIIIITMKDYPTLDEYDVININLAIKNKSDGKPSLKLLDARANWSMNKKAKQRAKIEHSITKIISLLVVILCT